MKWSQSADRRVVEAVVATFRGPVEDARRLLLELNEHQWTRSCHWMDASGMALYFLARLQELGLEAALPAATLLRLQQNKVDNRRRTASMLAEFTELNLAFQQAGVSFCNLKGFTLVPDSCPDADLRYQLDFDFLVDAKDLGVCRKLLEQRGYFLRVADNEEWQFRTASDELADIADLYKPSQQRCVEIHFACEGDAPHAPMRDACLDHLCRVTRHGLTFPALTSAEQFVGQAAHLFKHLCSTSTRLAHVLEFARHIEAHFSDNAFWTDIRELAEEQQDAAIAVGVACMLSSSIFSTDIPGHLEEWIGASVPIGIVLWVERYGRCALLADAPGTKLSLFLLGQLDGKEVTAKGRKSLTLVPRHLAPRILYVAADADLGKRLRAEWYQFRFTLFRLRFHIVEGLRYAIEAPRWRRYLALHQRRLSSSVWTR